MLAQAKSPEIVHIVKERLKALRSSSAPLTVITARGVMVATILKNKPEILQRAFSDGSTFQASESFMRRFLHDSLHWSHRKATREAQKHPINWEDLCEKSFFCKVYVIKEEDIPALLYVNSDQTQVIFAPGDKMTWAKTGAKQVSVVGAEEKRAFTVLVSVSCSRKVLPMQAIYGAKTPRGCPSLKSEHYNDLLKEGFLLEPSGTTTYWSNQETMHSFVDKILTPYFSKEKTQLGLPPSQKSLWSIDVWSVHESEEFKGWVNQHHPTIILDHVPGGCTGDVQPCDVGIQRPFKLSIKRSYHEDVINEVLQHFDLGCPLTTLDTRIAALRDRTP